MIDVSKTFKVLNIDSSSLSPGSALKVYWRCDSCERESLKPYRDCIKSSGKCAKCHREERGYVLGNSFGKKQSLQGKCLYCDTPIRSQLKTCKTHRVKHSKIIRSGSNNPAWTGKRVCACGSKKSHGAERCRECSFLSGLRSGEHNGRFINENRESYLQLIKAAKLARGVLSNLLISLGKKKNSSTERMLGYTFKQFSLHIESLFDENMTWENHGINGWHVDHVVPVACFIKANIKQPKIINALWNLRPCWAQENIVKSSKVSLDTLEFLKKLHKTKLLSDKTYYKLRTVILKMLGEA